MTPGHGYFKREMVNVRMKKLLKQSILIGAFLAVMPVAGFNNAGDGAGYCLAEKPAYADSISNIAEVNPVLRADEAEKVKFVEAQQVLMNDLQHSDAVKENVKRALDYYEKNK